MEVDQKEAQILKKRMVEEPGLSIDNYLFSESMGVQGIGVEKVKLN